VSESDTDGHVCKVCEERFETERALRRHVHEQGIVD